MKKIIYVMTLGILFLASYGQANAAWNTYPSDCPNPLSIGNYTTGEGIQDGSNGCWTRKSVSADAGQTINVAVFYDNTNTTNADNVVIKINQSPAGSMTSKNSTYTFSGNLTSSSVSALTLSQVTANLSSSETLTFSKARWYKKSDTTGISLPNGQTGYEAFNGGLSMGTIAKDDWGTILFSFSVGKTVTPPATCSISSFTTDSSSINSGSSANLYWNTSNCNSVNLSTVGYVGTSGSYVVRPTYTTTYTLSATGTSGSDSKTITITVNQPENKVMSGYLTASPTSCIIPKNASSCQVSLSWNTVNPISTSLITLLNRTVIYTGNSGTKNISVTNGSKTYYFENNGVNLDEERVTASCATGSTWSGTYCAPDENPETLVMKGSISTSPTSCSIPVGSSVCNTSLAWNTLNPIGTSAVTKTGNQTVATGNSGSKTISISNGLTNFYLYNNSQLLDSTSASAYCASGTWNGSYCKADVVTPPTTYSCSISSFTINGSSSANIVSGDPVTLAWTSNNCNSVSIPGVGNNLDANGSSPAYPTVNTTYRITGSGTSGLSQSRTVSAVVTPNVNPVYSCMITDFKANGELFTTINSGNSVQISWVTENCYAVNISEVGNGLSTDGSQTVYPTSTRTYRMTAVGLYGSSQSRTVRVTVTPVVIPIVYPPVIPPVYPPIYPPVYNNCSISNFTANQTYVNLGTPVSLNWNTSNCSNVSITSLGNVSSSGNGIVYPGIGTNTYVLTAYGYNSGTQTRTVYVTGNNFIPTPAPNPTPIYNSCAVTTVATNVSQTVATLNGIISNSNSYNTNTYFEYGTTVGFGLRTPTVYSSNNTSFSQSISGLKSNTIYYFRMVSDCGGSTSYGSTEVFRTLGSIVINPVRPVIIQGTTVVGVSSPIMLKIENRYEAIGRGDIIEYTVTYKNIGKTTLVNPILQVIVPKGITIINASKGTYTNDTRTLTAPLDDLKSKEEGVIYVQGLVDSLISNTAKIVTTALLVYTNTNDAQENAIAYVLNIPKEFNGNSLGAAALFGGLWGVGLIGWLLIIILILIILLMIRRYFYRPYTHAHNNTNIDRH